MSYEAFWIPGLDTEFDPDEALEIGDDWLRRSSYAGDPMIVLYAANMTQNRPMLAEMGTRHTVVSPQTRSRSRGGSHAVLAVWPSGRAMEVAEQMATPDGGLCVIPGSIEEVTWWIRRTGAQNLTDPDEKPEALDLDPEVCKTLDSLIFFDGHNRFISGAGKVQTVRGLREMIGRGLRPDPGAVEAYALQSG